MSEATEGDIKREVEWKYKLNYSKVEAVVQRSTKNMFLRFFEDTCASKLKHNVK